MRRYFIIGITVLILTAGLFWLRQDDQSLPSPEEATPTAGYYLKSIKARQTDDNGLLSYSLSADTMLESIGEQTIKLENIDLSYFADKSDSFWRVTAKTGQINHNKGRIHLRDKVQVFAPADQLLGTYLSAPSLIINTDSHTASSPGPVFIEQPPHRLQSSTFFADLRTDKVTLSGEVSGQFDAGT
ncbi:MAG: LPS export ABC transporter periplasmic protein LptC [Gammaproteobacteria bacterium]|nr:LPS export ABC transporter periplasmic protein LptC [Gammaproteobacteria bacterium]